MGWKLITAIRAALLAIVVFWKVVVAEPERVVLRAVSGDRAALDRDGPERGIDRGAAGGSAEQPDAAASQQHGVVLEDRARQHDERAVLREP